MIKRKGFILYIVIAILLGLSILAFALNDFKSGAVKQLSKNVDQNRLIQLCKSANVEILAYLRTKANEPNTDPFSAFRQVLNADNNSSNEDYSRQTLSIPIVKPAVTQRMADESGYSINIESTASVTSFSGTGIKSFKACNAYVDIITKAYRTESPETVIEVHERHDVRVMDFTHYLDNYVLFVKNYCKDLNNPYNRITIEGIPQLSDSGKISRVYFGTNNYPNTKEYSKEEDKKIWLDICFDDFKGYIGNTNSVIIKSIRNIFPKGSDDWRKTLNDKDDKPRFFEKNALSVRAIFNIAESVQSVSDSVKQKFKHVDEVKKIYEILVNAAADGCLGVRNDYTDPKVINNREVGEGLKSKCNRAISNMQNNTNSAGYRICEDYVSPNGFRKDGEKNDYSGCEYFDYILNDCLKNWAYIWGYLDADAIWNLDDGWPKVHSNGWNVATSSTRFWGLTLRKEKKGNSELTFPPYFEAYQKYNSERIRVGKMLKLYGENFDRPVLVEGPVFLRFFKLAYFNAFTCKLPMFNYSGDNEQEFELKLDDVPITFTFKDPNQKNQETSDFRTFTFGREKNRREYFMDNQPMSNCFDIPINSLLGDGEVSYIDSKTLDTKKINRTLFNPEKTDYKLFHYPLQQKSSVSFGRLIDYKKISFNYPSPKEFLEDRVRIIKNKKVLCLDGITYIQKGDLNFNKEEIYNFKGSGLIYISEGNVTFGDKFKKYDDQTDKEVSELPFVARFYLRDGRFIFGGDSNNSEIEAGLTALSYKFITKLGKTNSERDMGFVNFNKKDSVIIRGNLIVDALFTGDSSANGLARGGKLIIVHDGYLADPDLSSVSSVKNSGSKYVSIGKVKTIFAINASGKE